MSKALVIKGANFSANKVEMINLIEVVPCTGITLSKNAIAFTEIGASDTITATVTPSDTTESIIWTSSNEDVVTVNNGVVTCVGVGSATISASCGSQIASCSVTSMVTMVLNDYDNGYAYSGTNLSDGKDYVAVYAKAKQRLFSLKNNALDGYQVFSDDDLPSRYPYPLPNNTHYINVSFSDDGLRLPAIILVNSQQAHTYVISDATHDSAKAVSNSMSITLGTPLDVSDYTTLADGFVFVCNSKVGSDVADITTTVVSVTFS